MRSPAAEASTSRCACANSSGSRRQARCRGDSDGSDSTVLPLCITVKATAGCAAASRITCATQCPNSVASALRNLRRAGVLWKRSMTSIRVPTSPAAGVMSALSPRTEKAVSAPGTRDVTVTSATAAIEASASPRKPSDSTASSSSRLAILLVAWRVSASASSSRGMPPPLSATAIRRMPPPSSRTSMSLAPASRLFSTSSLTTDAGRSITSPAAIWLTRTSGSGRMVRRAAVDMRSIIGRACTAFPASALAYHPRSFPGFRVVRRVVPRDSHAPPPMDGINWLDLFRAADRFLIAIVEQNVILLYAILFAIFFAETGLVVMAFLPGDSLLFVAGAVSASPVAQAEGLNVHVLVGR